jgi:hypothetical protein
VLANTERAVAEQTLATAHRRVGKARAAVAVAEARVSGLRKLSTSAGPSTRRFARTTRVRGELALRDKARLVQRDLTAAHDLAATYLSRR